MRTGRSFADAASDAGRGAVHANAEVVRRSVETTSQAVHTGLRTAEGALEGFTEAVSRSLGLGDPRADELAEQSAANVRIVSEATAALGRGAEEASRHWINFVQRGMQARLDAANRLAGCRSAPDLFVTNCELWRESLERTVEAGQTITRTSLKAIDDAGRALEAGSPH